MAVLSRTQWWTRQRECHRHTHKVCVLYVFGAHVCPMLSKLDHHAQQA